MLGDVKMRSSPEKSDTGKTSQLSDGDRKMIEMMSQTEQRPRLRARFLSMSKSRRPHRRRAHGKLTAEGRILLDDFYTEPARLLLGDVDRWDFNIFTLDTLSGGRSLFLIAHHLFQTYDLVRGFRLDTVRLLHFFSLVEENYHETNPYHNAVHAADVTQSMHCYLQEKELYEATSDLEKMVALIAALTHDLDHPGVNNGFLIVTANHLATLYENISVLENHHYRCAVGLLQEAGLLDHLSVSQRADVYRQLKALILATDITRQQEFLLKFSRYIESGEFQYSRNDEHRLFMLQIALKCADISNPCRPWRISQRWSRRVCHEFFLQGDTERSLQIPVTPLCDRLGNTTANIQHGFMQFVAKPLFNAWNQFMGSPLSGRLLSHLSSNQASWKAIMDGVATNSGVLAGLGGVRAAKGGDLLAGGDGSHRGRGEIVDDSSDSEAGYDEFTTEEEDGEQEMEPEGEESMDAADTIEDNNEDEEEDNGDVGRAGMLRGKENEDATMEERDARSVDAAGPATVKTVTLVLPSKDDVDEEDVDGRSEEADVVHNDVNRLYHYQAEPEESCAPRPLSPVSEGSELGFSMSGGGASSFDTLYHFSSNTNNNSSSNINNNNGNGMRRSSVPAIVTVRKDLGFYLGLRRDSAGPSPSSSTGSFGSSSTSCSYNAFSRRQSLPTTAMYFHGSSHASGSGAPDLASVSPRSLSVDALLARPKITNLSPGGMGEVGPFGGAGFPSSVGGSSTNLGPACSPSPSQSDTAVGGRGGQQSSSGEAAYLHPHNQASSSSASSMTPLYHQTLLLLQGGDLTRFTSNSTARRASYEPGLAEHTRKGTFCQNPLRLETDMCPGGGEGPGSGRRLTLPNAHAPCFPQQASEGTQVSDRDPNHHHHHHHQQQHGRPPISGNSRKHLQEQHQHQQRQQQQHPRVGLAASWPSLAPAKRRTTNGTTSTTSRSSTTNSSGSGGGDRKNHFLDKMMTAADTAAATFPSPPPSPCSPSSSSSSLSFPDPPGPLSKVTGGDAAIIFHHQNLLPTSDFDSDNNALSSVPSPQSPLLEQQQPPQPFSTSPTPPELLLAQNANPSTAASSIDSRLQIGGPVPSQIHNPQLQPGLAARTLIPHSLSLAAPANTSAQEDNHPGSK